MTTTPTISFTLPADDSRVPEIFEIINGTVRSRITVTESGAAVADPVEEPDEPTPKPAKKKAKKASKKKAKKASKKKAKKTAEPKSDPEPDDDTPALTAGYVKALARDTSNAVGIETIREIFAKFKVTRIGDLPEAKYPKFVAALNEARSLVA